MKKEGRIKEKGVNKERWADKGSRVAEEGWVKEGGRIK